MKIASEIKMLVVMVGAFVLSEALIQPVWGQPQNISPPIPGVVASAVATNAVSPFPAPPSIQMASAEPMPAFSPSPSLESKSGENLGNLENKVVPDSVKEIVKHLDRATTEDMTLDDLNAARQAVARIEALIDIEKHLAELDRVRQEREKKTSFAAAIPASALQPPISSITSPVSGRPSMPASENFGEILRIMGRNGHYSALVKMSNEKTKTVEVGDQLSDGSKVVAITTTGVDVVNHGTRQSLHIKNVDTVFGGSF